MSILKEAKDTGNIDFSRILVEVYSEVTCQGETNAKDLFLEVNKAEPVKLVDMPGVASQKDRKIITGGVDRIQNKYDKMFSASQKCQKPHVNIDNLRDAIFAAQVISRHSIKSDSAMEKWLLTQNDLMAKKYREDEQARSLVPKTALAKAEKFGFFLGLDAHWYNN